MVRSMGVWRSRNVESRLAETRFAQYEAEIARLQAAGRKWQDRARAAESRNEALLRDERDLIAERDRYAGEAHAARHFGELLLRNITDLSQQVSRTPEVVVESLLTGIAPLFLGYKDADKKRQQNVQELITAMGSQGLTERGDVQDGVWFPDFEFDATMEGSSQWASPDRTPPQGGSRTVPSPPIMASTVSQERNPAHRMTDNGVERTDGQSMFQAGITGPPPVAGVE